MTMYSNSPNKTAVDSMTQKAALPIKDWKGLAALTSPIIRTGFLEIGVSWTSNPTRVMDYFRVSKIVTEDMLKVEASGHATSWCSFFAHWLLSVTGAKVLPGKTTGMDNIAIRRFVDTYVPGSNTDPFKPGAYEPKPGDMYYMPYSPLAKDPNIPTDHIGFIIGRQIPGDSTSKVLTLDGNSANEVTLMPYWHKGKGGGMVCINARDEKNWIRYYIPQPNLGKVTAMPIPGCMGETQA